MNVAKTIVIMLAVLCGLGLSFLVAYGIMYLWNWLAYNFNFVEITYWKAYILYWVVGLMFGRTIQVKRD